MDWAVLCSNFQRKATPPFRDSPEGGMVLNEFSIQGNTTYVVLPNRYTDFSDAETVAIDTDDLEKMSGATDKYWWYDARLSRGVHVPCADQRKAQGLARLLLDASPGLYRSFIDGDPLNCRRSNLVLLPRPPFQTDWLWNAPLPVGFTLVKKLENSIVVRAKMGADSRLMWQYLLERWQFCRSKGIHINVPRIHKNRTSFVQRISAIIQSGTQCTSFDIGDDGAREWQEYGIRETAREAA